MSVDQGHSGTKVDAMYAAQNMNEADSTHLQTDNSTPSSQHCVPKKELNPPDKADSDFGLSVTVPSLNDLDDINDSESDTQSGNGQMLSCPKCGQSFSADCHAQLVEHLEVCCD